MKIGYVKLKKKENSKKIVDILFNISIMLKCLLNYVEKDRFNKPIYTVYNENIKSKEKLIKKLKTDSIDYIVLDSDFEINYSKLNGRYIMRAMVPELLNICYKKINPIIDEVYICTNVFNKSNIELIKKIIEKVKVVNIVTENKNYYRLERNLEEKNIFITVSGNKRKSLKNASLVLNLDLDTFNDYNINRHMIIIDIDGNLKIQNSFDGIIVRKICIKTNKVLRVFSEFDSFNKEELIEAEIAKLDNYEQIRDFIVLNKIKVDGLYNDREIQEQEFKRIKSYINQKRSMIHKNKPKDVEIASDDNKSKNNLI